MSKNGDTCRKFILYYHINLLPFYIYRFHSSLRWMISYLMQSVSV